MRRNIKAKLYFLTCKLIIFFTFPLRLLPIKNNKIFIDNFGGLGFSDSPKYLVLELQKKEKYDIYWKLNNIDDNIVPVHKIKNKTILEFVCFYTSKFIISNVRLPLYLKKRRKQIYIETWHGGIAFKKIGFSGNNLRFLNKKNILHSAKSANYYVSNSDFCSNMYRKDFKYKGPILEIGLPRNDIFFNITNEKIKQLKSLLKINNNTKIVCYAPTFRDNGSIDFFNLNFKKILDILKNKTNDDWKFILRLHPEMLKFKEKLSFEDALLVTDDVMDIYETLCITDFLITDYSSIIFEYFYLDRPICLYVPDYYNYNKDRGLNFELDKLPFPHAYNFNDLIDLIDKFDIESYKIMLTDFKKGFKIFDDGNAAKRLVEFIERI